MSERLPALSGKDLIRALRKSGWSVLHTRGSHTQLTHSETGKKITVPSHVGRDLKRGLLHGILRDVGMSGDDLRKLL